VDLASFFFRFGKLSVYVIALGGSCLLSFLLFYNLIFAPIDSGSTEPVSVIVQPGDSVDQVFQKVVDKGLAPSVWALQFVRDLKGVDSPISAGEYALSKGYSTDETIASIFSGNVIMHPVTVAPGSNLNDVVRVVAATPLTTEEEFAAALTDENLLAQLQVRGTSFEGYLFPKSYEFTRPITPREIIISMVNALREQFTPTMLERSLDLGLNDHSILTLASIIEKETVRPEDKAIVSSVYHNRIRIRMPLQSDAALRFGKQLPDSAPLPDEARREPNPYNTYLSDSLPPGPICNPGLNSIVAALYPQESTYLYFFKKPDGSINFSSSLREHEEAMAAVLANGAEAKPQ